MSWSTKLNGWVLDLKSEDQRDYGSINKNTNDCGTKGGCMLRLSDPMTK
ncbi:hypothetical protein PI124_g7821 [Phytophthora idaei]|nr:hypothetical protein PI124_g7821 [Phytophthora idaei]